MHSSFSLSAPSPSRTVTSITASCLLVLMLQISLSSHVSWAASLDLILFLDRQKQLLVSSGCAVPWVQMNRLDSIRDSVSLATAKEL